MAKEAVERVIGKALLNAEFRELLFAKPEEALSGFDLTAAEKKRILWVDSETLELLAQTLCRCIPPVEHPSALKRKNRHVHPRLKGGPRKAGGK